MATATLEMPMIDGGFVVGIVRAPGYTQLTVQKGGPECETIKTIINDCAVRLVESIGGGRRVKICIGDAVRWKKDKRHVLWTPKGGEWADVPLPMIDEPFHPGERNYQ